MKRPVRSVFTKIDPTVSPPFLPPSLPMCPYGEGKKRGREGGREEEREGGATGELRHVMGRRGRSLEEGREGG